MRPIAKTDGHGGPRLIDEFVPRITTVVEDIVVGEEHAVGEPIVADELPDVLDRVAFGTFCRQWYARDVGRYGELVRHVPSRLVDEECGVAAGRVPRLAQRRVILFFCRLLASSANQSSSRLLKKPYCARVP
jgi:hypothetical protein